MERPAHIGAFHIDETLGRGGMGVVYGGAHRQTGVPVALKVIAGHVDEVARRRFHREVQSHASLTHPGIVYLFEYGDLPEGAASAVGELEVGRPFVVMERAIEPLERARRQDASVLASRASRLLASLHRLHRRPEQARRGYEDALEWARRAESPRQEGLGLLGLACLEVILGELEAAFERLREAADRLDEAGDEPARLRALRTLAGVMVLRGMIPNAVCLLDDVMEQVRQRGYRVIGAGCVNELGELARRRGQAETAAEAGRRERAERVWRLGRRLWDRLDDTEAVERVEQRLAAL